MKYFALILVFTCSFVVWSCDPVDAAEFTVDERSALHFAASGTFGFAGALVMKCEQENLDDIQIIVLAGTFAQLPGLYKEIYRDADADLGDLAFNALGGYFAAWLGVKAGTYIAVQRTENETVVSATWRW